MGLIDKLQREIFDLTGGYLATWLPDADPDVGDFGILSRGRLLTEGNLDELGYIYLEYYVGPASTTESFKYTSDITISASAGLSGQAPGYNIKFNTKGSFLYHFQNATPHRIENKRLFYKELAYKIITGEIPWDENYVIVDEVYVAERSTILVSNSSGGEVNIRIGGMILNMPNFADPSLNLAFSVSRGTIFDYSSRKNTRPLYHTVKPAIKPRGSGVSERGPRPNGPSLGQLFERVRNLVGDRDIKPEEIELSSSKDDLVEATLKINGRVANFEIAFEPVSPAYAIEDHSEKEEQLLPIERVLVFE